VSLHAIFMSYWPARALMAGVELGIFDQLARAPQTAEQVAVSLRLNPDATRRLLQAFAAMGLLEQQGGAYRNGAMVSAELVKGSPRYIGGIAQHHAENLWPLWSHLPTAIREGRPVLREAFGGESDPFAMLAQNTEGLATFLAGMEAGAKGFGETLSAAHDFSRHRHVIDVGGGTGVVAGPVAQRNPHLRVTLFDMPQACALTGPLLFRFKCGSRLSAHGGDFFRAETFPAGADAAILARVLHDWGDADARTILANIYRVLQPGGTVLVMESLMDAPDPATRAFTALSDLMMLVLTNGGRERTGAEYEALLAGVGFRSVTTHRLSGALAVIKGHKI
jgi:SAM-dependent methyltransferase